MIKGSDKNIRFPEHSNMLEQITGPEFKLFDALKKLGVDAVLHYSDGHKTVDIAVPAAKLYIEVDGIQHFTHPDQIERDFKRSHYSDESGFSTFYVTNQIIDSRYLDEVATAIAEVVKGRERSKSGIMEA